MLDKKTIIFSLVSFALFMDMMVYGLIIPVVPSYSLSLGADELIIGIIFGAYSAALLIAGIPFGFLADRIGRRPLLISGMLLLALSTAIFGLASDINILIIARIVQGISAAATWTAGLALLADTFDRSERGQKLGLAMSMNVLGALTGPVIGGLIFDNLGYTPTFLIPSVMAAVAGVLFFAIPHESRKNPSFSPFEILRRPNDKALLLVLAAISIAGAATFGIIEPYMPVYFYEKFSATPTVIGLMFGLMAFLSMIAQPLAGKIYDRRGGGMMIPAGMMLTAAIITASTLMPSILLTGCIFSLLGVTTAIALMPMLPLISDLYGGNEKDNSYGLIYGAYNTLFSIGLAAGPFIGGISISFLGFPHTLYGFSLVLVIAGVIGSIYFKKPKMKKTGQ
ncbi:MFS transporter [Methanocella sp. CWC-04]|uniref:MFS transporter n=1 Tax=Methanooceanicella nereidis TaxID=2052831 RepID=A0AAP2RAA9_9EURY|nr:MFS transporter [Methanocella sp. CWC-04]MCD1293454.1 MFS transporter [Methanocella sp. CWC-04]